MFLLKHSFDEFIEFLESEKLLSAFDDLFKKLKSSGAKPNFNIEISELRKLKETFNSLSEEYKKIDTPSIKFHDFYFGGEFQPFCEKFLDALIRNKSRIKRNKLLQIISMNLRKSGEPFIFSDPSADKVFTIVELINDIIKSHGKFIKKKFEEGQISEERNQIVIDDLRNPIEIMFFKQRFSAYYTLAINREPYSRRDALSDKYSTPDTMEIREAFWKEEYNEAKNHEFYKANISACIQQADIHITFLNNEEAKKKNEELENQSSDIRKIENKVKDNSKEEAGEKNEELEKQNSDVNKIENEVKDNTSPYFSWKMQLLKYVSLIGHPGLVTPSPEERCMQMAFTAKHNSGCISRHVGAAITDENYSIKAIGWNNTPEGQVPCVLRHAQDLIDPQITSDKKAFSTYEYGYVKEEEYKPETEPKFRNELINKFEKPIEQNKKHLNGRNVCFCFKDVKNSYSDGKNQVHTRSLHAEESAFLQIAKYGGIGIENGKLFTTASPCELCSKKAYQLGIKVIYYIDPYPGISDEHILSAGSNPIKPRLFNGAIGNAYHWLYDPIMPYKDELTLLLGNKFKDYASKQEDLAKDYKIEITEKAKRILELETKLKEFENGN